MAEIAENAVTNIVVVRSLNVIEQNDVLQFNAVANNAVRTYQRRTTNESTVTDFCVRSDNAGRTKISCRENLCGLVYPHAFFTLFVFIRVEGLAKFENKIFYAAECFPRVCEFAQVVLA